MLTKPASVASSDPFYFRIFTRDIFEIRNEYVDAPEKLKILVDSLNQLKEAKKTEAPHRRIVRDEMNNFLVDDDFE